MKTTGNFDVKGFFLLTFFYCLTAWSQDIDSGLRVFVSDASTGHNIRDAKITLEGPNKVALDSKYKRSENYYYFDSIPSGYNTVMVYHKKYNQKGFQDINSLPDSLSFLLYDKNEVHYDFLKAENMDGHPLHYTYIEDPFKIIIRPKTPMHYNDFKKLMAQKISALHLNIDFVNPYYEDIRKDMPDVNGGEAYPDINQLNEGYTRVDAILPVFDGGSTILRDVHIQEICLIFRKKDGTAFKRFNDPIIEFLKSQNLDVYTLLLTKSNREDTFESGSTKPFKVRDKKNREYNQKHDIDSSMCFFYINYLPNSRPPFTLFRRKKELYGLGDVATPFSPDFVPIPNDRYEIPEKGLRTGEDEPAERRTIPAQEKSIGLGILDQYDYYSGKIIKREFQ